MFSWATHLQLYNGERKSCLLLVSRLVGGVDEQGNPESEHHILRVNMTFYGLAIISERDQHHKFKWKGYIERLSPNCFEFQCPIKACISEKWESLCLWYGIIVTITVSA